MTADPPRWRNDETAPLGARELLRSARRPAPMDPAVRARTAARVAAIAATPLAAGLFAKWLSGKSLAMLLSFGLLGAAIGIGIYAIQPKTSVPSLPPPSGTTQAVVPSVPTAPAPAPVPTLTERISLPVVTSASATAAVPPDVSASAVKPPTKIDTLEEEQAMITSANAKLASDPAAALKELDAYAAKFPKGQLMMEREFKSIDALKRLGRTGEAKTRGQAFLAAHPTSFYSERVQKLIDGL